MKKNKVCSAIICCILIMVFVGCNYNQKEIELSSNVKQDLANEEKNSIKLDKINELNLGDKDYTPICWKDNDNIIANTIGGKTQNKYFDIINPTPEDIDVCNINIKTSQITKIKTIEKAYCGDLGKKEFYGKFLYMKDNLLWMYNAADNSEKMIYDLSEVIKEFNEPASPFSVAQDSIKASDIPSHIRSGFVKGSDKYIYIMSYLSDGPQANQILRILDLTTGKVYKDPNIKDLFTPEERCYVSWFYSKSSNSFFASSFLNGNLYEYKLSNPTEIKIVKTMKGLITDISQDGSNLFAILDINASSIGKNNSSIIEYNIKDKKYTKIVYGNATNSSKNQLPAYIGAELNNDSNIINYSIRNVVPDMKSGKLAALQCTSYLANFDGKSVKNSKLLPTENIANKSNANFIIFNSKGDSFVYSIFYFDLKDSTLMGNFKSKMYIYKINK